MIWGDFINQIRNLHLELLDRYEIKPSSFTVDVELNVSNFPFPTAGDDYGEWETPQLPEKIMEAIEFHPIERVLLEGPLLPIQEVLISTQQWNLLFQAMMKLENEWLNKMKIDSPERITFIEQNLRAKFIQLQKRSGHFGLKSI